MANDIIARVYKEHFKVMTHKINKMNAVDSKRKANLASAVNNCAYKGASYSWNKLVDKGLVFPSKATEEYLSIGIVATSLSMCLEQHLVKYVK